MGIELMNVKGNITLGGDISGEIKLDNTITEEIKEVLNECKHIQTITSDLEKERKVIDLWDLESGIYYLEGSTYGFYGDMTHGTNLEDNTQRVSMSSGSILIIGSGLRASEIDKNQDMYVNVKRSFLLIGGASVGVSRFSSGTLDYVIGEYSGSCNLVETIASRVNVIDNKARTSTYPNTKAVKDYVDAAIAAIEIPEATGGITEITENTFAYNLPTGIYKINGNGEYALYPDDGWWPILYNGVAIISNNIEIDGEYTWIFIGMDDSWAEAHWQGAGYLDPDSGEYIPKYAGIPEIDSNKRNNLSDSKNLNNTYYPSTQAVVDYFNSKLVPIEIDVGSEHADNEYYNATTVDQVLIEVVGLMEEMMEYIETFAIGLDELNARVEALENK